MAAREFQIKGTDLAVSVKQIVKDLKIEYSFKNGIPGRTWMRHLLNRYLDISVRQPEKLSKVGANVTESNIRCWFKEIKDYCDKEMLQEAMADPSRIFNTDETGFELCPNTGKVLATKGQKNVYDLHSGSDKESITVLTTVNVHQPSYYTQPNACLPLSKQACRLGPGMFR